MILTESDLHAYNRGELPPDAVRKLEDDPLAMQDAARLRAISAAIRQEAPIAVAGRAETIERLRRRAGPRVGVSGWVWTGGAASVLGLVLLTLPHRSEPAFVIRNASYDASKAAAESGRDAAPLLAREQRRSEAQDQASAVAAAPMAGAAAPTSDRAKLPDVETKAPVRLAYEVDDLDRARTAIRAEARRLGGSVDPELRSEATGGVRLTVRVPTDRLPTFLTSARRLGTSSGRNVSTGRLAPRTIDKEARPDGRMESDEGAAPARTQAEAAMRAPLARSPETVAVFVKLSLRVTARPSR